MDGTSGLNIMAENTNGNSIKNMINWKIDFGQIITIIALLSGIFIIWGSASSKLDENIRDIQEIRAAIKEMNEEVIVIRLEQERVRTVLESKDGGIWSKK